MSVDRMHAPLMLSRRQLLAGAAALSAAGLMPERLLAAMEPQTFQHGDFSITLLSDGHLVLPASILAPDVPKEELDKVLSAAGIATDNMEFPTSPVLVRAGSDIILFDTGSGSEFQPTAGKLEENLRAAGVEPGSVTKVVFTHAHPDHAYGTVTDSGLRYPSAAYYVASAEWDFWQDPELKSKMPQEMHTFVDGAQKHLTGVKDKVTMLKPGDEIVAGLAVLDTSGHTPGHVSFELAGGDGLIIVGDAIPNPVVFFPHPDWRFGFDAIPDLAIASRKAILDRAASEKIRLIGFHWGNAGGFAERDGNAYKFVAA